jgi:hypothetical protein
VPNPDSDSLKHRFCPATEKNRPASFADAQERAAKIAAHMAILAQLARQIIPLCGKQAAVFPENFARKIWLTKSSH